MNERKWHENCDSGKMIHTKHTDCPYFAVFLEHLDQFEIGDATRCQTTFQQFIFFSQMRTCLAECFACFFQIFILQIA